VDFGTVRDELVAGVLNSHPSTTAAIAAAMVRQLAALEPETVPFMERSGSFSTIADRTTYGPDQGLPRGLHRFEHLFYDLGASILQIGVVDELTLRYFQEHPSAAYPERAAWLEGVLQFAPAPVAAYTVKWLGFLSSKRDSRTGEEITADTSNENLRRSNPWLAEGVVTFRHLVLADYYSTDPASARADMAESNGARAAGQMNQLRKAQQQKKDMGSVAVVPNAFDQYASWPSRRVQTIFPGARG